MVTRQLKAYLIRTGDRAVNLPVEITLGYDVDTDPLAVEAVIYSRWTAGVGEGGKRDEQATPVTWLFSRDLLVEAVATMQPAGTGDVKFRTGLNNHLFMCLKNPFAHADFKLPLDEVKEFLADTADEAQNLDSLHLGLDGFLNEVLGR